MVTVGKGTAKAVTTVGKGTAKAATGAAKFTVKTTGNAAKTAVRTTDKVVGPVADKLGAHSVGRNPIGAIPALGEKGYMAVTSPVRNRNGTVKANR